MPATDIDSEVCGYGYLFLMHMVHVMPLAAIDVVRAQTCHTGKV